MNAFGYVSVIFSVVIGLGLSHLLKAVVELVKARRRVRFFFNVNAAFTGLMGPKIGC